MSTRSFTHLTRLIQAAFILALCGLLAVGVYAADKGNRSRSDSQSGGRDSAKQDNRARDGKDQRSDSSHGSSSKQPADSKGNDQARSNRDDSRSKPGSDDHKTTPAPTTNDYRPGQRPDTNTSHPGDSPNRRDDGSKTHWNIDTKPSAGNWGGRDRNRPQVYRPDNHRDVDGSRSRSYQPPSYHESTHYYPSHPKPYHYGHWVFDGRNSDMCRRSVYFHYGYFPYLQVTRIHTLPYIVIGYRNTRIVSGGGYYLSRNTSDLDLALADIRDAWTRGRYDLIDMHVDSNEKIAVLLDGSYDYSINAEDYADMTSDALDEIRTVSFTWESVRERTDGNYTAFAKHIFDDASGNLQTVYVSYTLQRMGQDYVIVEVGSSNSPLM